VDINKLAFRCYTPLSSTAKHGAGHVQWIEHLFVLLFEMLVYNCIFVVMHC
jgi:hypothetical protein